MADATRIAVSNQKGGVAKSTDAILIGGALSAAGHDVLLVDTDPQGFLTRTLGFREHYNRASPNLADAFNEPTEHTVQDLVVEHEEFDILPSNIEMFGVAQELTAAGWKVRERLSMVLDQLEDGEYDFVVVDSPPSLDVINDNVLLACRNLIIPVEAMESSMHALDILTDQVGTLEERYDVDIDIAAVIVSNVNYPLDNDQKKWIDYFHDAFDWCPVYEVRHRASIKRNLGNAMTIFHPDAEETDQNTVFESLARDLEELRPEATA